MTQKTLNILYIVFILLLVTAGAIFFYKDAYRLITGRDPFGNAASGSDRPPIPTIDTAGLKKKIDAKEKFLLMDVRTPDEFASGHIEGAVNIPVTEIDNIIGKLSLAKDQPIITMCDGKGCNRSDQATTKLIGLGFANVTSYHEGITAWQLAGNPITTASSLSINDFIDVFKDYKTNEISVTDAAAKISQGAVVIDVQTSDHYSSEHLNGAIFMDLSTSAKRATDGSIPKNKTIIFYSEDGNRSKVATAAFLESGYTTVYSLAGGLNAWKSAGNGTAR